MNSQNSVYISSDDDDNVPVSVLASKQDALECSTRKRGAPEQGAASKGSKKRDGGGPIKRSKQPSAKDKAEKPLPDQCDWKWGLPRPGKPLVYCVWTNKGGVGKTTITFQLATRFAERSKQDGWKVLVIDMCPQANVTTTLLHSSERDGPTVLEDYMKEVVLSQDEGDSYLNTGSSSTSDSQRSKIYRTVAGYLIARYQQMVMNADDPKRFLVEPWKHNEDIDNNLYLICGDWDLETVCLAVDSLRTHAPGMWKTTTHYLVSLIESVCKEGHWAVFIDTNPAMSMCTQLAIAASQYLIMPINADDYSAQAVNAMFRHVYDIDVRQEVYPRFAKGLDKVSFAKKAKEEGLSLPKVQVLINNRTVAGPTTRSQTGQGPESQAPTQASVARASREMGERICNQLFQHFQSEDGGAKHFVHAKAIQRKLEQCDDESKRQNIFHEHSMFELRDFFTSAVLSVSSGTPLSKLIGKRQIKVSRDEKAKGIQVPLAVVKNSLNRVDDLINNFIVRIDSEGSMCSDRGQPSTSSEQKWTPDCDDSEPVAKRTCESHAQEDLLSLPNSPEYLPVPRTPPLYGAPMLNPKRSSVDRSGQLSRKGKRSTNYQPSEKGKERHPSSLQQSTSTVSSSCSDQQQKSGEGVQRRIRRKVRPREINSGDRRELRRSPGWSKSSTFEQNGQANPYEFL